VELQHPSFLWRDPEPRRAYDAIIVGAGGHGLATAYYLAKHHGITDVAVLEKGWLGGGNMGRNTTIIRSNYLWDESAAIYEHSLKLWEGLSEELDYDILFSQRGVLNLAHNLTDVREGTRRVHANRLNGVDAEWLDADGVKEICPIVDVSPHVRYPVLGATYQPRAGIAKHDHVAVGLRAGGGRPRRRPHPELRGDGPGHRGRPGDRGADHPGTDRLPAASRWPPRGIPPCSPRWRGCAFRCRAIRSRRSSPSCSSRCSAAW
jgi:glycine/D-amino acid oxidase-like deaminating enzyme